MKIRKARTADAVQIHQLVNLYASRQQMLPRTMLSLYENIRDFMVAVEVGPNGLETRVIGCSALHFTWAGDRQIPRSQAGLSVVHLLSLSLSST